MPLIAFCVCKIYCGGSTANSGKEEVVHMFGRIVSFK